MTIVNLRHLCIAVGDGQVDQVSTGPTCVDLLLLVWTNLTNFCVVNIFSMCQPDQFKSDCYGPVMVQMAEAHIDNKYDYKLALETFNHYLLLKYRILS